MLDPYESATAYAGHHHTQDQEPEEGPKEELRLRWKLRWMRARMLLKHAIWPMLKFIWSGTCTTYQVYFGNADMMGVSDGTYTQDASGVQLPPHLQAAAVAEYVKEEKRVEDLPDDPKEWN